MITCHLTTLKNCMRGFCLCRQLIRQNFSFYFVLNLDTGPLSQYRDNDGDIPVRGSGNYATDEQKEIARLKRELRDTQDALDVLKKAIGILGQD